MGAKPPLHLDNQCWSGGALNEQRLRGDQHHSNEIFWELFPQGQHIEAVVQKGPRLHLKMDASQPNLAMCRSLPHVMALKA